MFLPIAALAGFLIALGIHWLTWTLRRTAPSFTTIAGVVGAVGLTGFCLLFLDSDIAVQMLIVLRILWITALVLGSLQAYSLRIAWWKGIAAVFFEMALAFLAGAAVNLGLQQTIPWFSENFPGVDVYGVINGFLWSLVITLLLLAIGRPLLLLYQARRR